MNNKLPGLLALVGAPFLCIDAYVHAQNDGGQMSYTATSLSGFFNLLYISGWLCSIIVLHRIGAIGANRFGRIITCTILVTLTLANCWNVYELILPAHNTLIYTLLDCFWPISNVVMIGVGIAVIRAGRLTGWKRYVPFACGLWLPLTILASFTLGDISFHLSNAYTALAWTLLAIVVLTGKEPTRTQEEPFVLAN